MSWDKKALELHWGVKELPGIVLFVCSVGRTERSALRALREQLFAHKSDLISAFQKYDPDNTGTIAPVI